ncbi:peptidase M61 [Gemmatimonadetes bacterium T265]|nr:peptidase M61 [Gemmatimonadetes bacterium T265]
MPPRCPRRPVRAALLPAALALGALPPAAHAQVPTRAYSDAFEVRRARTDPQLDYTVRVDTADLTGWRVTLVVRRPTLPAVRLGFARWAPGAYRIADFGQYAEDLTATRGGRTLTVTKQPDSTWRIVTAPPLPDDVTPDSARRLPEDTTALRVSYRVAFPSAAAAAAPNNRSFVRRDGALLDGPLTFAFPSGGERLPARVHLDVPAGWQVVTGLVPTSEPHHYFAPSVDVLLDSPILAGPAASLRVSRFDVDGAPHRVAYWRSSAAPAFDSARFVSNVGTVVRAARRVMGELPYREYAFLFVDGPGGGLEHLNSTTIGVAAARLARDPTAAAAVTAHEFFHLWNVKRLRPRELGPFDYGRAVRTPSLWWSEGVTDYFAGELLRRAGLRDSATAARDFAAAIEEFLNNPGSARVSPERSSLTAWDPPSVNGGYSISYYLQGRLLGELLELRLRNATGGRRGMDDLVRLLYDRFSGPVGFTPPDVEKAASEVCGCNMTPFFAAYVHAARPIDWAPRLATAGWQLDTTREAAADSAGRPRPDLRVSVLPFAGIGSAGGAAGTRPRLAPPVLTGAWYQAGLRGGDLVVAVNDAPVNDAAAFTRAIAGAKIGDSVAVDVLRPTPGASEPATLRVVVGIEGYDVLHVRLTDLDDPSERQQALRRVWLRGPEGAGEDAMAALAGPPPADQSTTASIPTVRPASSRRATLTRAPSASTRADSSKRASRSAAPGAKRSAAKRPAER